MNKEYKSVQELLDVEAFVADKDGGIYLVEPLMDQLEEGVSALKQRSITLDAKLEEIQQLNETIKNLREEISNKENDLNEKDNSINELNEKINELNEQLTALNTGKESDASAIEEKDATINELNETIANLQQTISEKDAEIEQLGSKAPETPASKSTEIEEKQEEDLSAHSVTHEGMTLKEETAAIKARIAQLQGWS